MSLWARGFFKLAVPCSSFTFSTFFLLTLDWVLFLVLFVLVSFSFSILISGTPGLLFLSNIFITFSFLDDWMPLQQGLGSFSSFSGVSSWILTLFGSLCSFFLSGFSLLFAGDSWWIYFSLPLVSLFVLSNFNFSNFRLRLSTSNWRQRFS